MTNELPVFPEAQEPESTRDPAQPRLYRVGRLPDYYDWPTVTSIRQERRTAHTIASITDTLFKPFVLFAPSVAFTLWVGARAASAAARRALGRRRRVLQHIEEDWSQARPLTLSEVSSLPPATPVRVRGRVRVQRALESYLAPARRGPYEWLLVREELLPERLYFIERGHDFDLVDDQGSALRVGVSHARTVVEWHPDPQLVSPDIAARLRTCIPRQLVGRRALAVSSLAIAGLFVEDGAAIEVLGYTRRVADPAATALPREMPSRTVLVGDPDRPLVLMPEPVLARRRPAAGAR